MSDDATGVSRITFSSSVESGFPVQAVRAERLDVPPSRSPMVLVADRLGALSATLRPALVEHAGCRLVYARSVNDIDDLVARGVRGEVAMVSVRFNEDTARIIRTLRSAGWARVIALTSGSEIAPVVEAVQAGASGVVRVACLEPRPQQGGPPLTSRELQVVRLVADGRSNKAIAGHLSLSALTVKNHLARIGRKLGVGDRAHIVAVACRCGVIPGPVDTQEELNRYTAERVAQQATKN